MSCLRGRRLQRNFEEYLTFQPALRSLSSAPPATWLLQLMPFLYADSMVSMIQQETSGQKWVRCFVICGLTNDLFSHQSPPGARLVAFDGVSVEVGKWTFDAVRKSIQARDRPLTLSFRNDYLTLEQRKILTKAVQDVEKLAPPPHRTVEYRLSSEPSSVQSPITQRSSEQDDDASFASTLPARSVSSASHNFRSFSEAGSSTGVLSAVGPLVTNILKKNKKPFSPDYLRKPTMTIEQSPQHYDFQSELL